MSAAKRDRAEGWLIGIAVALGLPLAVAVAVAAYNLSREPLHPDPGAVTVTAGPATPPRWAETVTTARALLRKEIVQQNVPGISVAVGVGGDIVWAEGFGWKDLQSREPVTPKTRFRIGHVSKALTSAGVGVLRDRNRIHLDDEIQVYVPAYPKKEWPVTVRELMGHLGGVRHYRDTEWGDKPRVHCERASGGLDAFSRQPLVFKPGSQTRYSTYGWVLVSAAVETAANESFFSFMRKEVFEPFGMHDTVPDAPTEPMPDRATSYFRRMATEQTSAVDYSCFAGGGAFLSTPSDLIRFAFALSGGKFLKPATVSLLQSRQQLVSGENTDYGLGWMIEDATLSGDRTRLVGHASRTIEGASTSFLTYPDRGLVVAVTANLSFANMKWIASSLAHVFAEAERTR